MEILVSQNQGRVSVTIFRLVGRIQLDDVDELVKRAHQAFDGGARNLLIDLGEVPSITSAGIRALTEIYKVFNPFSLPKSPHVKLLDTTESVRRVLSLVGLDAYIEQYETRQEALDAF